MWHMCCQSPVLLEVSLLYRYPTVICIAKKLQFTVCRNREVTDNNRTIEVQLSFANLLNTGAE